MYTFKVCNPFFNSRYSVNGRGLKERVWSFGGTINDNGKPKYLDKKSPLCPPRTPRRLVWYRILGSDDAGATKTIRDFK